jgi:hypothetical protein
MGIIKNDGYNNFCVAGKNVVYFVQMRYYDYTAYNLRTGARFVINREKITSNVLDACVDSGGNLLTAFQSGNGVLVFRNDSILHDDQAVSGGVYEGIEYGYAPRFLHLRTDGTYIGVFSYSSYYCESDADLPLTSTSIINVPVNIREYTLNRQGPNILRQEWDNVMLPFFPELNGARLMVKKRTGGYNHWRAIRYDSRSNEKTEIMHIVARTGDSVDCVLDFGNDDADGIFDHESCHIIVKNHQYDDPKKKHKDEKEHTDKDETFYNVYPADVSGLGLHTDPDTYSVESNEFSIPIGEADDYELNFERLSVDNYTNVGWPPTLTAGQMGFMHPAWTSTVSVLGLKKNIGQSSIVDVQQIVGGYLILTSDGVYQSDGTTARMLCSDFKCWNNNFRLNRVSRSSQSWSMASKGS